MSGASDRDSSTTDRIFSEGQLVNDDGTVIQTYAVQLGKAPPFSWPVELPAIAKGCPARYAIEECGMIRLSKPDKFRYEDGTLIGDPSEGVTQRKRVTESRENDPADMERAEQVTDENNRAAQAIGSKRHTTTGAVQVTNTTTNTNRYGKNCWIWCAAIEPSNEAERDTWIESLDSDYDHVTTIHNPRAFARALATMVARQLGPRGASATYTHPSKHKTFHPFQAVLHGPVAYVDDPHAYMEDTDDPFEQMVRSVFFKHRSHENQREYRFVVWTEREPEQLTIDLEVSTDMLAALQPPAVMSPRDIQVHPDGRQVKPAAVTRADDPDQPDPPQEATPLSGEPQRHPDSVNGGPVEPMTIAMPLPFALLMKIEHTRHRFGHMVQDGDTDPRIAAAAFHAERLVVQLLAEFVDPVADVEWADDVMIIKFKIPNDADWDARLAVGPLGTAQYRITVGGQFTEVNCDQGWMIIETLVEDLKQHGVEAWQTVGTPGEAVAYVSTPPSNQQTPQVRSSRTATINRMTVQNADGLTDSEVDRINAEVESGDDDARITRIVVTYPSGQQFTVSGVREGLAGTYSQRALEGNVTLHVATMHPATTISIDPADSTRDLDRHQVVLPDGEDTTITVTATSPDGSAQSHVKIVLKRSGEQHLAQHPFSPAMQL